MMQGITSDIRPLPPGWQRHWSQERNQWYYVQVTTVPPRITFEHPLDILPTSNVAHPQPSPYPEPQLPLHHLRRAPSVSSVSSGVSSLSSLSVSSPRSSVAMSVEHISTSAAGRTTPARPVVQGYSGVVRRNVSMSSIQMPHPQIRLQPNHTNTLPGHISGQEPVAPGANIQTNVNPMARTFETQPNGYINPDGMYKPQYTRIPNKKLLFGPSMLKHLKEEREAVMAAEMGIVSTRPVVVPNMGMGMQAQMDNMNAMVPGQVPVLQQNVNFGMQSVVPLNTQINVQKQPPPSNSVDLKTVAKVADVAKNILSGVLSLTTGISIPDFVDFSKLADVISSRRASGKTSINAKQLEAVLAKQPGASYQDVINALMILQQQEQISMLQTGRGSGNVNYQDLIMQVQKIQDAANHEAQQAMAMNAGMQETQIGMGGAQCGVAGMPGMAGAQGQETMAQQNAVLRQQLLVEQLKLAQMQMLMGQGPMMNQQPAGLQMQTAGVVDPMMQPGAGRRRGKNPQMVHTGAAEQEKKKKKKTKERPLPAAPEKRKKKTVEQTQFTQTVAPLHIVSGRHVGYVNAAAAMQTSQVQQWTGAGAYGHKRQQSSQRGVNQHQPGRAVQGERGLIYEQEEVVEDYDLYLVTVGQDGGNSEESSDDEDDEENSEDEKRKQRG